MMYQASGMQATETFPSSSSRVVPSTMAGIVSLGTTRDKLTLRRVAVRTPS
jgi:hypothetical protein